MSYLISPAALLRALDDPHLVIVDCRFRLGDPTAGFNAYQQSHLPGAFYLDLEKDLSSPIGTHGGRHPLPDLDRFVSKLGEIGVDSEARVVVYDDLFGMMASRLSWLLHYLGHTNVQLLDGGWQKWVELGYPTTDRVPSPRPTTFIPNIQPQLLADRSEVLEKLNSEQTILIDSREEIRYRGEKEPIDPIAGHIPSAHNYFWQGVVKSSGEWKSPEELVEHFKDLPKDKELIVYCGSGVSATPNYFALKEIGYPQVKLYSGSWSDWITYPDSPIAKKPEE